MLRQAGEQVRDLATELNLLENEPGARLQQHLGTDCPPSGWPSDPPAERFTGMLGSCASYARKS
jgi:hypothetical protein